MNKIMLNISHVAAGYGEREILSDVSLQVGEGEFVGLIGTNGTGKSTLLKCISGLLPLKRGMIEICGRETASMKSRERARLVAVVPQSYHVDYDFTVEDIVLMGRNPYLGLRKRESEEDYAIVAEAMKRTHTDQFRGRLYNELSGGERQRIILARAIAQQPQIILLDEPTSALDLHHQIEVMELIADLNRTEKMTVVAVLHDINLAARYCSRIVMLREGRVYADGTPSQVVNRVNMEKLYQMRLMVRENPLFEKPEIVPLRVLREDRFGEGSHVHVICGADGASRVLEELDACGYRVTAGILNQECGDWKVCRSLELECLDIPPFTAVTVEVQEKNLQLMRDADVILVADMPIGSANMENLSGLEQLPGKIFFHKNALSNDFSGGALVARLQEIEKEKKIRYFGDHDQLLEMLRELAGKEAQ